MLQVATFSYNILFKFVLGKRVLFSLLVANNPLGLFIDKHDPILLRKLVAVCYALKQTQQYCNRYNAWQIIRTG